MNFLENDLNLFTPTTYTRTAVRYVRDDIAAYLVFKTFFAQKTISVKLLDITSKGAAILTIEKLSVNKRIQLILEFKCGKEFVINASIVRHRSPSPPKIEYGIKFDFYNNELGDYLLMTQNRLVFK